MNKNITPRETEEKIKNDGTVVIDVRTKEEYIKGHIKGSRNIDISGPTFMEEIMKLDSGKNYLVYCLSGGRSSKAQKTMIGLGLNNIYNLNGGITAWIKDGLPTTRD